MEAIIGRDFPKKVIPLINNAKRNIKIVVFDWRWYVNDISNPVSCFNQALVRASRRGVCVDAVINSSDVLDILQDVGFNAKIIDVKNLVHAKLMIIDDKVCIIGSHNYTQNAFTTNFEVSVIHDDENTIKDFLRFFNSLWQAKTISITK